MYYSCETLLTMEVSKLYTETNTDWRSHYLHLLLLSLIKGHSGGRGHIYLPITQLLVLFFLDCCHSGCGSGGSCGCGGCHGSGCSLSEVWRGPNPQTGSSAVTRVTAGEDGEMSGRWTECTSVRVFVMNVTQRRGWEQPRWHMFAHYPAKIAWNKNSYLSCQ